MNITNEIIAEKSKNVWENNLKLFPESNLKFPDENLIRIFSKKYNLVPPAPAKMLDHGFGHGNNLIYFNSLGYDCSGCEISEHLIKEVNDLFGKQVKQADLRLLKGDSGKIPFEDNSMDIVISWNAIHYNGTRKAFSLIINEFCRVLRPGGCVVLSTLHLDNAIFDLMTEI